MYNIFPTLNKLISPCRSVDRSAENKTRFSPISMPHFKLSISGCELSSFSYLKLHILARGVFNRKLQRRPSYFIATLNSATLSVFTEYSSFQALSDALISATLSSCSHMYFTPSVSRLVGLLHISLESKLNQSPIMNSPFWVVSFKLFSHLRLYILSRRLYRSQKLQRRVHFLMENINFCYTTDSLSWVYFNFFWCAKFSYST